MKLKLINVLNVFKTILKKSVVARRQGENSGVVLMYCV